MDSERYRSFNLPPGLDAGPDVLAVGVEAGNTVCLISGGQALVSREIGDLRDVKSFDAFTSEVDALVKHAGASPTIVAHDLDPESLATKFAVRYGSARPVPVQRQFACAAGCMAEHGETGRAIAVVYDRAGCGADGTAWGAEFFSVTPAGFSRLGHVRPLRWPGGMLAVREPWRMAMSVIHMPYGYNTQEIARDIFKDVPPEKIKRVFDMLESGFGFPFGSSMDSFLDALAAILEGSGAGLNPGEGAARLGAMAQAADPSGPAKPYPCDIIDDGNLVLVDPTPTVYDIIENVLARKEPSEVALRLLETVVAFTRDVCARLRERVQTDNVILAGSVFRSGYLLDRIAAVLGAANVRVLAHESVFPGGGAISLGQAYAARAGSVAAGRREESE